MAILELIRRQFSRLGLLAAVLAFGAFGSSARAQSLQYKFEAVYLFNFLQFTEWPAKAFPSKDAPIIIGVLGNDPFGTALNEAVQGENIKGRRVIVKHFSNAEEIDQCHALFISKSERDRVDSILKKLGNASILTVSDIEGFAGHGGAVEFFSEKGRLRFEVNTATLKRTELKVGSQLLKVARISGG